MDNQRFQFAILAAEELMRSSRTRQTHADGRAKRIFRIGSDRQSSRQAGRR